MPANKKQKVLTPDELHVTDRDTLLFYKGRHPAFPNSHFYIVKDTNKEVTFGKRLQTNHKIGIGYPTKVAKEGRSYATSKYNSPGTTELWGNKVEIAQWIRDDEAASREDKRRREQSSLVSRTRKLAAEIETEYKRADGVTKRDIIAAFIETLER